VSCREWLQRQISKEGRFIFMASKPTTTRGLNNQLKSTPIAVIGMASIFPDARNVNEYWDNIAQKVYSITDVPSDRWSIEDYYDPDPKTPDKVYCKRGGFIPDIDFDPTEFGLPPNILEATDVSQLLALVVARDVLEDAGYGEGHDFDRDLVGVILGVVGIGMKSLIPLTARLQYPVWEKVLHSYGVPEGDIQGVIAKMKLAYVQWQESTFPGVIGNVVAGRIANRFDLGGTNCTVDAACASSLAATKMAISELVNGDADMMIAGGVDVDNSIGTFMCFSKTPAFSKSGNIRPFDAEADGTMVAEGIGMVVLKRLEDAERDNDRIYAVIQGVGSSSDGRFKSIYAPRPEGQAKAMRRAYARAGFEPKTLGLVEAHGTGTNAGDPAEAAGLRTIIGGDDNIRKNYIALGSIKSQIGHSKATAGVAGLMKVALALHHKVLPPTINVTTPNPKLDLDNSPFYINTETRPWFRHDKDTPRRAAVSSFGFGGTNFHYVLEEYSPEHTSAYRLTSTPDLILLTAANPASLADRCREAVVGLQAENGRQYLNQLAQETNTLEIPTDAPRLGILAASPQEAVELLTAGIDLLVSKSEEESWEHPKGIYYRKNSFAPDGKVVALFSGQGSQYVEMGRDLTMNFPPMRSIFGHMDELCQKDKVTPISQRVYPPPVFDDAKRKELGTELTQTANAQPAIGTFSAGLYTLLQAAGFKPDYVAGHSFGEITALWAGGVISDTDFYKLVRARGKAMMPPNKEGFDAGTMLAVKGDIEKIEEAIKDHPEVTLANQNANNQVVLAGAKPDIEKIQQALSDQGFSVIPLPVSAAFHTKLVQHAQKPFARSLKTAKFKTPSIPVYSNSTGQRHADDPQAIKDIMVDHILNPVRFKDEIDTIYADGGRIFIEVGPKSVLTNLVKNILEDKPHLAIAMNATAKKNSDRLFRDAVLQMRLAGISLQNIDPYRAEPKDLAPRQKKMSVILNGGLYMTDKTRSAFEEAINTQDTLSLTVVQPTSTPGNGHENQHPFASQNETPAVPTAPQQPIGPEVFNSLEQIQSQFQAYQGDVLRTHEQYLNNEHEYTRTFSQLTQSELQLLSDKSLSAQQLEQIGGIVSKLDKSMEHFHQHQDATLNMHQKYLDQQTEVSQDFIRLVEKQVDLIGTGAASLPQAAQIAPQLATPAVAPQTTAGQKAEKSAPVQTPAAPAPAAPEVVIQAAPMTASVDSLKDAFLNIVSEKTGYPTEMLELDMDMESDLGIDSIKRVEILGALQEAHPELPEIEAETIAELRTLAQIIDHVSSSAPAAPAAQAAPAAPVAPAPSGNGHEPVALETPAPAGSAPIAVGDVGDLQTAFLNIVSEKTGYPPEMLELDMDMESDLGIDSIKRVEILGALQEAHPELPEIEAETIAELRTLAQIIDHVSKSAPTAPAVPVAAAPPVAPPTATETTPAPAVSGSSAIDPEAITTTMLDVVSEKTGYPIEMLELDMDMESDLGIDSIKRVEILGTVQDIYPQLPEIEAEAMAELRTMRQIIEHLKKKAPGLTQ
jgi:polyketide-type polyunsaturated fatty acid synthase PfaA